MSKYDVIREVMATRHGIYEGGIVTLLASVARKLGPGRPYIDRDSRTMGICAGCRWLPVASDAPAKAELTLRSPDAGSETSRMRELAYEFLRDHPGVAGSSYDPKMAEQWDAYHADMARIDAVKAIDRKAELQESIVHRSRELIDKARFVTPGSAEHRRLQVELRDLPSVVVDYGGAVSELRLALRRKPPSQLNVVQTNPSLTWKWCPQCGGRWETTAPVCEHCGFDCTPRSNT